MAAYLQADFDYGPSSHQHRQQTIILRAGPSDQTLSHFTLDHNDGPVDMVGWLRSVGGLKDQGGELSHMGITSNAARRGLEHVGQEARFGPMVTD